jgi:hypothetical protein
MEVDCSRLVCVFVRRSRTDEDETQLGKPNTAKSRKRRDSRQRKGMDTIDSASSRGYVSAPHNRYEMPYTYSTQSCAEGHDSVKPCSRTRSCLVYAVPTILFRSGIGVRERPREAGSREKSRRRRPRVNVLRYSAEFLAGYVGRVSLRVLEVRAVLIS